MPKSVAIIGTRGYPSYYGGFETAVRKLAPYLAKHGWNTTVYGRGDARIAGDESIDTSVKTVNTPGIERKSLSTLSYGFTAVLHAMRRKPAVALVMNVANGYWLPLLKIAGVRTVVNVDGIEWERAKWGTLAKWVFVNGARMTAKFADELIADSEEIRRRWRSEFGRDSVFIPYGGDEPEVLPLEEGLTSGSYVLFVARFVPENTVAEFFEAAKLLPPEQEVVIVGSSGYGGSLEDTASELDRNHPNISWLGHISDDIRLHTLWQHAGVYFHGHSVGGTNPALVQAMACGTRIVARDTVYNREVLGEAASYAQPLAGSIVHSIQEAMKDSTDTRAMYRSEVLRRVRETYNWDAVCTSYEQTLLNQLERVSK